MALTPAERRRRNAIELLNMAMLMAATSGSSTETVAVLTLVDDGLETASPYYIFSSTAAGTLRWDFHTSATPPAAGSGDLGTDTQAVSSGNTVFSIDLSPYPGTGYLHFRVINSAGTSNILTSQVITVSGGWSPTDLGADLLAWYDASDSGSITLSASDVTDWNDLSGNGNHLTQATSTRRPVYSATSFNTSYPGITFDGSDDKLENLAFVGTTGTVLTAFGVAILNSGAGGSYGRAVSYAVNGGSDAGSTTAAVLVTQDNGTQAISGYRVAGKSTKAITYGTPFRFVSIYDGTNHTIYVDNVAGTAVSSTGSFGNTSTDFRLGGTIALSNENWKGVISEVVVCKTAPDSTLRQTIDDYLKAKWGLV